jgi:multiple sugar transport system permease protein
MSSVTATELGVLHGARSASKPLTLPAHKRARRRRSAIKHLVLIVLSIIFVFPMFWMVLTSLKPLPQAVTYPPTWIPHPFLWSNYPNAMNSQPFGGYFYHTLVYCVSTVIGVVVSSSLVAYGFSRLQWWGRNKLFYLMVSTLLLPYIVTLIPLFVLYRHLGWVGSYKALIIPTFFGSSVFSTFLLRQFFMTIPESLSEAARMDGANEFYIYSRIIMPLSKPAVSVVALFQFIYAWNDFLGPLIYLNKESLYPISLGLNEMLGTYSTNWSWLMAAATVAALPMIALFFLTQKTFVQGITLTGVKG